MMLCCGSLLVFAFLASRAFGFVTASPFPPASEWCMYLPPDEAITYKACQAFKYADDSGRTTMSVPTTNDGTVILPATAITLPPRPTLSCDAYTVEAGDYADLIARRHGMALDQLRELNPQYTDLSMIRVGDVLKVTPSGTDCVRTTQDLSARLYTVRAGDTAFKIAAQNGLSLEQLRLLNPSAGSMDVIRVGDTVVTGQTKNSVANAEIPIESPLITPGLFEGDIAGIEPGLEASSLGQMANFLKGEETKWPGGVLVYELSSRYRDADKEVIKRAMDDFHQKVECVSFREKRPDDTDWVYIVPKPGCSSYVGRTKGRQDVALQLGPGCIVPGIIQHELMHALGFYHEQARTDRDDYVDINWDNLKKSDHFQFQKYADKDVTAFGEPYDFKSIMHYGKTYFAIDKNMWTIRPKFNQNFNGEVGQREGLSEIDIKKLKWAYCPSKSGPCPRRPGWRSFQKKCYYFSFFDGSSRKLPFAQARNFCRKQLAAISNPLPNVVEFFKSVIKSSSSQIRPHESVWIANCQSINGQSADVVDSDCYSTMRFICEMTASATR